jgi:hypothetical protein
MLSNARDGTRAPVARAGTAATTAWRVRLPEAATLAVVSAVAAETPEVDVAGCP